VALLQGLTSFRGRSSLKTWLFGILLNRAKSRGLRESRSVSLSALDAAREGMAGSEEVALEAYDAAAPKRPWVWGQCSRDAGPEGRLLSGELQRCLEAAIRELPPTHRAVVTLRDIEGWSSGEVCQVLEITSINQRVILHRARQRIRNAVVNYLERQ
jgi:RNA polymerase sigma-70 factor (ECF subfamily)